VCVCERERECVVFVREREKVCVRGCVCVCVSYDCQNNQRFFRRVCKIAKSDYSSCPSVRSPTLELGFHGADFLEI